MIFKSQTMRTTSWSKRLQLWISCKIRNKPCDDHAGVLAKQRSQISVEAYYGQIVSLIYDLQ